MTPLVPQQPPVGGKEEQTRVPGRVAEAVRERWRGLEVVPSGPAHSRHAFKWDTTCALLGGLYNGSILPFIPVLARDTLHASTSLLALYNSANAVGNLFTPVVAHRLGARVKMSYCLWPNLIGRSFLFLMPFALTAPMFIWLAFAATAVASFSGPAYAAIMRDAYPAERRGQYMGLVRVVAVAAAMLGAVLGGALLARERYTVIFPLLSILGLLSVLAFARIGVRAEPEEETPPTPRWRDTFAAVRRDPSFKLYCTCFYLYGFGNLIIGPVMPVVQVDLLHISHQWVGYLSAAGAASGVLGYLYWGRVVDRHGPFRLMLRVVGVLSLGPVTYFLVFLSPHVEWLLIAACAQGFGWAGGDLGYLNAAMRFGRRETTAAYAGMFAFLQALRGIPGPFLGAFLSDHLGPRWVFLIALGFWVAAVLVLLRTGALQIETEAE